LFYSHYHQTETKENTNQTRLKSFWAEIQFNLQHIHQSAAEEGQILTLVSASKGKSRGSIPEVFLAARSA